MLGHKSHAYSFARKALLFGGASALAILPQAFAATVTINTARTTPIETATADTGGVPGDVTIDTGGSITLPSGTAVTLNSDNTVTNLGAITLAQANNDIGILVSGNRTGSISHSGTITLSPPTDTSVTDYADGGAGIRIGAGSSLTGNLTTGNASTIAVTGDTAAGIDILGALNGNLALGGAISIKGANSSGVNIAAPVSGDVSITAIQARGVGTKAVNVAAPIGGAMKITGSVQSTGFDFLVQDTSTGPSNYNAAQAAKIGGPTIAIGSSITDGLFANGPDEVELVAISNGTFTGTPTTRAAIAQFGSQPAIHISPAFAATPADIHIGVVGTGSTAFGFFNRGDISAKGIYNGVAAQAVRIEGATVSGTPYTTTLDGGIGNEFSIAAIAVEADATGIVIGSGAIVPSYTSTSRGLLTAAAGGTAAATSTGLLISPGGQMTSIDNGGLLNATFTGPAGSAYGVRDLAGSLTTISNTGRIAARLFPAAGSTQTTGAAVAIDVSANGGGVTLTNDRPANFNPLTGDTESFGRIRGDILFGSGGDTFNQINGIVTGSIDFGGGNNALNISGGSVTGAAAFGTGADVLAMSGGSFTGSLTDAGGGLTITSTNGALTITNTGQIDVTSATFSSGSTFSPTVDPASSAATLLSASTGEIRFETGAHLALSFANLSPSGFSGAIVQAQTLTIQPALADLVSTGVPFLYNVSFSTSSGGGFDSLNVQLSPKTPAELGLPANWVPALDPVLEALSNDNALGIAFLSNSTQQDFKNAFSQLLPNNTDALFETTRQTWIDHTDIMRTRAIDIISGNRSGGIWGEERIHSIRRSGETNDTAYNGQGLMTAFGLDDYVDYGTVFGVSAAINHGTFDESRVSGAPVESSRYIGGLYLGAGIGNLVLSASANGAFTRNSSDRSISFGGVSRTVSGKWNGSYYGADLSASYLGRFGIVRVMPEAGVSFLKVSEESYTERGGADPNNANANAAALAIGARDEQSILSHVGLDFTFGDTSRHDESAANYNPRLAIVPDVKIGWLHDFKSDPVKTTARYVNETTQFTMVSDKRLQDLFTAEVGLVLVSDFGEVRLRVGGRFGDGTSAISGGLSAGASF